MLLEGLVPEYQTISKVKLFWIIATQSYLPQVISWLFCKVTSQTVSISWCKEMTLKLPNLDETWRNSSSILLSVFMMQKLCSNKQIEPSTLWINLWKRRQRRIKTNDFVFLFSLSGNLNKMWWIVEYRLYADYAVTVYSQLQYSWVIWIIILHINPFKHIFMVLFRKYSILIIWIK